MIRNLNITIKDLQQQLNDLRDSFTHNNPLQSIVESLTAKNLKLESDLKSFQEKAAQELQKMKAQY